MLFNKWILGFLMLYVLAGSVNAQPPLRVAVVAYHADVMLMANYQPAIDILEQQFPAHEFELNVITPKQLNSSSINPTYDFLLLDPAHYLKARRDGKLDAALLTLKRGYQGQTTSQLGGVMFTRQDNHAVTLKNLAHYRIAATHPEFLENYPAQAYALQSLGYKVPEQDELTLYDSAAQVVEAVLQEHDPIGFVRTGVLEKLVQSGQLSWHDLRILNDQPQGDYPFKHSTDLYPEWTFVARSGLDADIVQRVAATLLDLSIVSQSQDQAGYYGFVPARDYLATESTFKALSVRPYDDVSDTWWAFIKHYAPYFLLLSIAAVVLIFLSWFTYRQNQHLSKLVTKEKEAQLLLTKSNQQLDTLLSSSPTVIYSLDPDQFQAKYISSNCSSLYGVSADALKKADNWWQRPIHDEDLTRVLGTFREWRLKGCTGTLVFSYRLQKQDDWIWIEDRLQAIRDEAGEIVLLVGSHSDVTERHSSEEQLELWASVFANAREGIAITTPRGDILDVNTAFSRITGYTREEILGENPRILNSGRQSREFYEAMWYQIVNMGFWEGEVWNKRKDGNIYAQNLTVVAVRDAQGRVSHYISLFSDITRQKRNEEQLEHIAYYDSLTGLANRTNLTSSLNQSIARVERGNEKFALAFLDLDGFKEVNDTFGHEIGDLLLIEVAKRMLATLSDSSTVARFGGDEFVLLMPIDAAHSDIETMLNTLLEQLSAPFSVTGLSLQISASIGVTYYPQERSVEADQLIRQADQAMYQAKITGRNRLRQFDLSEESILVEQHRFYEELQTAYAREEFCLYYQPKVNMRTQEVIGYEALIRWQHPEHGIMAPAAFLPAVSNQPLELQIGTWVIKTALAQIDQWQRQGFLQGVSVNLAGYQLQQPNFIDELKSLIEDYPESVVKALELEILETSAIEDLATVSCVIDACKDMGMTISLDDFGTGYSTLSHLKELSVDILKIDHGFVRDMLEVKDDLAIIKGVIGFAEAFSLKVIAEGVETPEHMARLLELGCELGQGYCISRPMPADEVLSWYRRWCHDAVFEQEQ
ncbi:EAL domain-containing protein [Marinomonas ostreistagni]|uniref:EAL domain-containing protein n=1 Tax=Marinomonas ostreistagni TaxID=359209 RepID=UPI0019504F19|nr:EAL domain-containing protein [Marinomonas ostreistagni]MBM6551622.1 EAL domain-containing protein [Marinomonas ostreistagni]